MKVSVGAGPINLAWHVYYNHYKNPRELSEALAPIFNAEMKELVAAGANFLQLEDLGVWLPLFTGNNDDFKWIVDVIRPVCATASTPRSGCTSATATPGAIAWRACSAAATRPLLPYLYDAPVDQFVLDFANRDMVDLDSAARPAVGQGSGDRRDRRAHVDDRDAAGGRRAHPQGDRRSCRPSACT